MELLVQSRVFKAGAVFPARMALVAAGTALLLAGCNAGEALRASETISHGYVVDEETIAMVPVGSSREQVLLALGSPSTTATFGNEVLYYVSQTRKRSFAFSRPQVVSQSVLAVYLGEDGRVTNLANYGLQDGKVFDFISRTTPTGGAEESFIGQLITGVAGGTSAPSFPGI
ncbi:outer membrane protein assembly factor BamE [Mesorhizobium sp. CAU 1741]|uniref:outer membrane protein assembly factor BamE n=1 Tax=Mesorhizobium sp. CAU 1741 TaxID=3140366 RepID=UPI00325BA79A